MPSPPVPILNNCEVLLSAQRLLQNAVPVMQQHTGRAPEMKRLGRELDAAATAIGAVAVDTAKKVNMHYALHQRVMDAKTTDISSGRTPFQELKNFTDAQTPKFRAKKKSATCDSSTGGQAEVRSLRERSLDADTGWPRPDSDKGYSARMAVRTIWASREGALFKKGGASAVVQEMLNRKLLRCSRTAVMTRFKSFRERLGSRTTERLTSRKHLMLSNPLAPWVDPPLLVQRSYKSGHITKLRMMLL